MVTSRAAALYREVPLGTLEVGCRCTDVPLAHSRLGVHCTDVLHDHLVVGLALFRLGVALYRSASALSRLGAALSVPVCFGFRGWGRACCTREGLGFHTGQTLEGGVSDDVTITRAGW